MGVNFKKSLIDRNLSFFGKYWIYVEKRDTKVRAGKEFALPTLPHKSGF
jgi:hypothetical protein